MTWSRQGMRRLTNPGLLRGDPFPTPRLPFLLIAGLLFLLSGTPCASFAHGDLHERIQRLDQLIAASPGDYTLYLKRGDLHRQHGEWSQALADFERARRLDPRPRDVDYPLGLTWLEAGQPDKALICLDRYLAAHPDHPQALLARARTHVALGERQAAVEDFTGAISRLAQPTPDLYIETARVLVAEGDDRLDVAMGVIEQGVRNIGPVVSLVDFAVTTESAHRRYDRALAWIDTLPQTIASQPLWLARRADMQFAADRKGAALANYRAAYAAVMQKLQRRNTPANLAFEAELRGKIAALEKQPGAPQ